MAYFVKACSQFKNNNEAVAQHRTSEDVPVNDVAVNTNGHSVCVIALFELDFIVALYC